jgi:hypothetical protein
MKTPCQFPAHTRSMLAKTSLVLTLIVSLLFVTQAQQAAPVEMKQGGACAGMECVRGCCANVACCTATAQQKDPPTSAPAPQQHLDVQLAAIALRNYTILPTPPTRQHVFIILDEASTAHSLSPRAASCIRLI